MGKYCKDGQATDDNIRRMRIACCIPKATNTLSEYVILIVSPLQQWLHEHVHRLPCATDTDTSLNSIIRLVLIARNETLDWQVNCSCVHYMISTNFSPQIVDLQLLFAGLSAVPHFFIRSLGLTLPSIQSWYSLPAQLTTARFSRTSLHLISSKSI